MEFPGKLRLPANLDNNTFPSIIWENPMLLEYCREYEQQMEMATNRPSSFNDIIMNIFIILYCLVFLVGFFGNSLVIYVVLRFSKMQTVTNMYIFNLAIADEMFLLGLVFLIITLFYKYWMFGPILCKIYMTMTSINQFTSSLLLTVMSADRYIAVCHPINAPRYRNSFIAKFICLTVWTISALLMVPIFMYGNTLESKNTVSCHIIWPGSEPMKGARTFTLYSFTLGFFIPFILIFLFYVLVLCRLRRVGPKKKSKEKKRSHRKITYLVLTVIAIYLLCCLPYWIGQLYMTFVTSTGGESSGRSNFRFIFNLFAGCLTYANSAANPMLYAFLSENFKKSFAKAFTCASGKDINAQLNVENSVIPKALATPAANAAAGGTALTAVASSERSKKSSPTITPKKEPTPEPEQPQQATIEQDQKSEPKQEKETGNIDQNNNNNNFDKFKDPKHPGHQDSEDSEEEEDDDEDDDEEDNSGHGKNCLEMKSR